MSAKSLCGLLLGGLFLINFIILIAPVIPLQLPAAPQITAVGAALWKGRTYEVILQGSMILAGIISILLLLGSKNSGGMNQ
jgi:hypothetical protein